MQRIGIIGLGVIFEQHIQALEKVKDLFTLIAVFDKDPSRVAHALDLCKGLHGMEGVRGTESLDAFLEIGMDTILIDTPPATHCPIAERCLLTGRNVLLEKPADVNIQSLERLYQLADNQHSLLHVAFHAAYAADLLWFLQHRLDIEQQYGLGRLCSIECRFSDPYICNGTLMNGRKTLGGSYLDSTINELSVCSSLARLPAFHTDLFYTQTLPGTTHPTVVRSLLRLVNDEDDLSIFCHTDWTSGQNSKTSKLIYENGFVLLNHSRQSVLVGEDGPLFDNSLQPRLVTQYVNLYADYSRYLERRTSNRKESLAIHRCLFEPLQE